MKVRNTTNIPNDRVRDIIRFTKPSGLANFDVMVRNSKAHYGGRAYVGGSSYHALSHNKFVVLRIGSPDRFPYRYHPYQYAQHKGRTYWIYSQEEMLVYLAAHELRHLWQSKKRRKGRRGYAHGARGRYSEVDTEAYAINKLRAWRSTGKTSQTNIQVAPATKDEPQTILAPKKAAPDKTLNEIARLEKRLKAWNTKLKRAKTAKTKIERRLKTLRKRANLNT